MRYKVKSSNIHLIVVYSRAYKDNKGKVLLKEWLRLFLKLMKGSNPQIQKVQQFPIG